MDDYFRWRDVEEEMPKVRYKLCILDVGGKKIPGWWTGKEWDGLNYVSQKVSMWKYERGVINC